MFRTKVVSESAQTSGLNVDTLAATTTSTDGTPDATSNLCCTENNVQNGDSADPSKKIGPNGCTGTVTVNSVTYPTYYQARIQALPVYTEVTIDDPWIETLNAVGGILALIDGVFIAILYLHRYACIEKEAENEGLENNKDPPGVIVPMDQPNGPDAKPVSP